MKSGRTKPVAETTEFYRRSEVVDTFEKDRYSTARGKLRYDLQNQMVSGLLEGTEDPLLEVAPGTGRFTRQLAEQGRKITALDASMTMMRANRRGTIALGKKVHYVLGSANALPFRDASFNTLLCVDLFSHIADPQSLIREMGRVLRVGAHLVINFTNKSSLMGLAATLVSNPLRTIFGRMEVYSTYHWSGRFLHFVDDTGFSRIKTTGLFFVDPRLFRFEFGNGFRKRVLRLEQWMSRRNCRFLYEQVWIKAE